MKYIDNKKFEEVIIQYQKDKSNEPELIEMLDKLTSTIILSFNFDLDLEDAKQDCFLLIFRNIHKFKPENGAAFNFFTTMILNHLRLVYTKKKVYKKHLDAYMELNKDKVDMEYINYYED